MATGDGAARRQRGLADSRDTGGFRAANRIVQGDRDCPWHFAGDTRYGTAAPMSARVTLMVIAKSPRPGRVKTRLCPPMSPGEAAAIAEAALADTLDVIGAF